MLYRWTLASLFTVCFCVLFPYSAQGQQHAPGTWQGERFRPPSLQSPNGNDSSPQSINRPGGQPAHRNESQQSSPLRPQSIVTPHAQKPTGPNTQELPPVWPQPQPSSPPQPIVHTPQSVQTEQQVTSPAIPVATHIPGYLGASTRNFYRERLCMHALTIRGVEVETVVPGSPAAQAGLRPARPLTTKETVVAAATGLLTLTPAAAVAPSLVSLSGGIPHGDIILAVNGQRVATQEEFHNAMTQARAQTTVYFTVHRGETNIHVPVRLTERPKTTYAYIQ